MWIKEIILAVIGLSAGLIVAGGLFAFIASLGVVSDIADRTHTGKYILLYEDMTSLGGIIGNLVWLYRDVININGAIGEVAGELLLSVFGMFGGIFTGCWAISLAETLNVFPIFIRRVKLVRGIPYIILSIAIGKGIGSFFYFLLGW